MQIKTIQSMQKHQKRLKMMKHWGISLKHADLKVSANRLISFIAGNVYKNTFNVEYDVESSNQSSTTKIFICGFWEERIAQIAKAIKK